VTEGAPSMVNARNGLATLVMKKIEYQGVDSSQFIARH
jgi:hypothetical protein